MKLIALEHDLPGVPAESFRPFLIEEARRVWELYSAGIIREMYFRQDRHAAVLILECGSVDEAKDALGSLPLVREKLIEFEVIALAPYPGFQRLFAQP
jgi:hypothetical protein